MDSNETLRILSAAQRDPARLSLVSVDLLLADHSEGARDKLRAALEVAALLHWFDEEILAFMLEPPLRAEAEALAALLRRLSLVETFPARGPGATNVLETARLTLRARMKTDSPERFAALSVRARARFAVTGEAPHLRIESLYHRFTAEPEAAERECTTLYNEWYNAGRHELLPALGIVLEELLTAGLPFGVVRGSALYHLARIRYHYQPRKVTVHQARQALAEFKRTGIDSRISSARKLLASARRGEANLAAPTVDQDHIPPAADVDAHEGKERARALPISVPRPESTTQSSTWTALQNPAFRRLWIASVISGIWVSAHDTAATWTMYMLTPSPFLLSLMSTFASLPFLLFTLPAGALADMVDRRKLLCVMNLWLATGAAGLAVLGWLHLLNPYLILVSVFFIGVGFAFNAPTWPSIVPQVVSDAELPSAAILSGLLFNVSGIIGPALSGLLIPLLGPNFVFAVNGACFLLVILALLQWKRSGAQSRLPSEGFVDSFVAAIRYVRYAPGLQIVLARNALFALFISVVPALMPVVGLKVLHLSSSDLGLLFTSMSAGSVVAAVVIFPWLRARYSPNMIITLANALLAFVYAFMAIVHQTALFFLVAAFAGIGWTLSACELWVAAQRAMPSWARGRMNAAIIMVSQGALALGAVIWGAAAAAFGVSYTLLGGAALLLISLILTWPLSINFTQALNFDPAAGANISPKLSALPSFPDRGFGNIGTESPVKPIVSD